ncbi:glycosyltransferase involved in cell wall biosynthesis [Alkalihalobacillus xiaoxiensis]|uniref:Glycosyltransferase involved in cell wall biosynthesis n=1 Tax=Shouchella xiaoxiensis TaxID=766895 RepID=A0ABS2SV53_9BACI|nr:glycosyltransferase [Shouchella xiaoxiensis]MBM7839410.1 glycosyltransferase involved in cell wall biosynthesis [Shouchella xiaoxiensis]
MQLMFTVDNYFYEDVNGNIFSKGLYPYSVWERYLKIFDEIVVVARVIKLDEHEKIDSLNLSSGTNVSFVGIPSLNNPIKKVVNYKEAKNRITANIKECNCLIARIPSEISSLAIKVAKRNEVPWAIEVVSCTWDAYWNHGSLKGKLYAPYATLKTKNEAKSARYALYVTENFLQSRYRSLGKTINCSNVEIEKPDEKIIEEKVKILKENKIIKIGFIGYLGTDIKGMDTALRALSSVKKLNANFEFHVLGGGDTTKWVALAKKLDLTEKVKFYGSIPTGKPVINWIDQLDIYIHPSRQEGLPRAVIEAMSRGCPVIASNVGGIPELINGECLHEPNDHEKLADNIIRLLEDGNLRATLAKNNFEAGKLYSKDILNQKRTFFWNDFKSYSETFGK